MRDDPFVKPIMMLSLLPLWEDDQGKNINTFNEVWRDCPLSVPSGRARIFLVFGAVHSLFVMAF
jgi:hypothetical protein